MIDTEKYVKIISSQTEKPKTAESVGVEINNQDITITENGVYAADAGYTGIGIATVNVPTGAVIRELPITPTTSQQIITAPIGIDGYSPITVSAVTSSIDENIIAGNIKSGVSILGVAGNVTELNGETVNITPTTSEQIIEPISPHNGITQATVSAVTSSIDANIQAENIKSGVSILGVEGSMTPAPAYYIEKTKDASGKAGNSSHLMDFSQFTDIGGYVFAYAYAKNTNISGAIDLSSLTTISEPSACQSMFYGCTGLTSVDLSGLTTVSTDSSCRNMFLACEGLISADLSSLTTISGAFGCREMFSGCSGLTSVDLSSLTTLNGYFGNGGCLSMFEGCISLTSVDLSSLTTISVNQGCTSMFQGCTSLTSVDLSGLTNIKTSYACQRMFYGCTSLTTLSFPALTSTSFGSFTNQFNNMLSGVTSCTVHFPSNLQSVIGSWSDVTAGFGGTNTTVLFDLTATS